MGPDHTDRLDVEKFDGKRFPAWKFKIQLLLEKEEVFDYVTGDECLDPNANDSQRKNFRKRERKAYAIICLHLTDDIIPVVQDCKTPKEVWDLLCDIYEEKSLANRLFLREKVANAKIEDDGDVSAHINNLKDLFGQLQLAGAKIGEDEKIAKLLGSLPPSYESLVVALETRSDELSWNLVVTRVLHENTKRSAKRELESSSSAKALAVHVQARSSKQREVPNDQRGPKPIVAKSKVICHFCGEEGHIQRYCNAEKNFLRTLYNREKGRKGVESQGAAMEQAKIVIDEMEPVQLETSDDSWGPMIPDSPECLLAQDCACAVKGTQGKLWFVDSGASQHMCNSADSFQEFCPFRESVFVSLANGQEVSAIGKGTVAVSAMRGDAPKPIQLQNVLCVPALKKNLISVSAMLDKGLDCTFRGETCMISRGGQVLVEATRVGKLFALRTLVNVHDCMTVQSANVSLDVWHQRLGHVNEQSLLRLVKSLGLNVTGRKLSSCIPCITGKIARAPFPQSSTGRSDALLDLVHSDVCGPLSVESVQRKRYFVTFVDDHSRACFVYFIRNKSDVLSAFREFESMSTTATGRKIKVLRSDNGGEYCSAVFEEFCREKGIQHQFTVPHSPQQNGLAERMNRTLLDSTRTILSHANLPGRYWADAVYTSAQVRNCCPSSGVGGQIPVELWTGRKAKVGHLKVFGCIAYAKVTDGSAKKLDPRAVKCVFLGYSDNAKGYKLINLATKRVFWSRDVVFFENQFQPKQEQDEQLLLVSSVLKTTESQPLKAKSVPVPTTIDHARSSGFSEQWENAAQSEYKSLIKNGTWTLVDLPKGRKAIGCKWVFRVKAKEDGNIDRFKARLVAKGYLQQQGIDYKQTFSPVVRMESVRIVLAHAVQNGLHIHQMDVTTAFLNGDLEEEIYMTQPPGFEVAGQETKVCLLLKSLYGLKQAPRQWHTKFCTYLCTQKGISRALGDVCIFLFDSGVGIVIIEIYVDDLLIISANLEAVNAAKLMISAGFDVKDLGPIHYLLGIRISYDRERKCMFLDQETYLSDVVKSAGMADCRPASTPFDPGLELQNLSNNKEVYKKDEYQSMVGSLLYAATSTRPDISSSVGALAQYMSAPRASHWAALKHLLRYVKGSLKVGLRFKANGCAKVEGYADSDWGGNKENRRSTSGYVFFYGNCPITWSSKLQQTVALSTTEAEYMAACHATQEAIWIRRVMKDLHVSQVGPTILYEDNQGCIAYSQNPIKHGRTKHIDIRYHFVREKVENKEIELKYCTTQDMLADIFTKQVPKERFHQICTKIGVVTSYKSS